MQIDPVVEIAPGADPADEGTWSWVDISEYARGEVSIARGRTDEDSRPVPSSMTVRLDNGDGRFYRRNPSSPYFPHLIQNVPIRFSLRRATDAFGRTVADGWGEADTGQAWVIDDIDLDPADFAVADGAGSMAVTAAGGAAARPVAVLAGLDVRDIEAAVTVTAPVAATGASYMAMIALRYTDIDNALFARARFTPAGVVELDAHAIVDGAEESIAAAIDTGYQYAPGGRFRLRAAVSGRHLYARLWPATEAEPPGWQLAAELPAHLPEAGAVGCGAWRLGDNTSANLVVAFEDVEVRSIRYTGYVSEWPPRIGGPNEDEVTVAASGVLRRVQRGEATSDARRTIMALEPHAYWPMEDPSGSEAIASACTGQPTGAIVAQSEGGGPVRLASAGPDGSGPLPRFDPGESVQFPAVGDMVGDWTIGFALRAVPGDDSREDFTLTLASIWGGHASAEIVWSATHVIVSATTIMGYVWDAAFAPDLDAWHTIVLQITTPELGDWECDLSIDGIHLASGAIQSSPPRLGRIRHIWLPRSEETPAKGEVDLHVGHLAIWEGHPDIAADYHRAVIDGHAGETAEARLARLADTGQVRVAIATPTHPEATDIMGPQQVGTIADTIDVCEETNRGQVWENLSGGLSMVTRADLYGAAADTDPLVLDGHTIAPGLEIQADDSGMVNAATARNWDGTSASVEDAASIAAIGIYPDTISVNTSPDMGQLRSYAGWESARADAAARTERAPVVPLNLDGSAELMAEWAAGDPIGRPVHLTGLGDVDPGPLAQLIEGYVETWDRVSATATAYCAPLAAWEVAQVGDPATGRVDTAGSRIGDGEPLVDIAGAAAVELWDWDEETGSDPAIAPSVEAGGAGLLVCAWTSWSHPAPYALPPSMTPLTQPVGEWSAHAVATEPIAAAGPTGTRAATQGGHPAGGGDAWSAVSVAVTAIAGSVTVVSTHAAAAPWGDPTPEVTTVPAEAGWWMIAIGAVDEDWADLLRPASGDWDQVAGSPPGDHASRTIAWARQVTDPGPQTVAITDVDADHFVTVLLLKVDGGPGGVDPADTAITVTSDHTPWTTDPADLPLAITVGPEVMTVTAVTGTGPTQSMTVERGTPALAHDPGAPVRLARTPRAGL